MPSVVAQSAAEPPAERVGVPRIRQAWTGDLDDMRKRRVVRVLTVYGPPRYFLDGGTERGITFELFRQFEQQLNERSETGHLNIKVVFIPVSRDMLIPWLVEGRGDIAAAGLTITPERQRIVDFSEPLTKPVSEILVTGPAAPSIDSIEGLAGQEVSVRPSSSYRSSLEALNQRFAGEGRPTIEIQDASPYLEDEDLLEMVNAGLLPWAIVDDYKARSWADVFDELVLREDIVFRKGGRLGYAVRKNSPALLSELNEFAAEHRQGTLMGNIMVNRYLRDFDWAANALAEEDYRRFTEVNDIFRMYGDKYGIDYLLVTAQAYQESQLDHSRKSAAGAVGIMQMLPSTAADPNVGIPDITGLENNIHAGVKYLDFIRDRYFNDPEIDWFNRALFSIASYNAGPARVRPLREKAAEQGFDPNVWFDNVEVIAAQDIGRETVQYVSNIVKYSLAYRSSLAGQVERARKRQEAGLQSEQ
jgi:membrane-bound lytic murein transglycosylase MltF